MQQESLASDEVDWSIRPGARIPTLENSKQALIEML